MSTSNKVIVVGGAGYLGSRLVPILRGEGWDVEVIDAGAYKQIPAAQKRDVFEVEPPGDGSRVVWLATIHREPAGFAQLPREDQQKWAKVMEDLMVGLPLKWVKAGHPLIYTSSMQVLELMGSSAYAWAKRLFEAQAVGTRGVQILRFGTAWGSLDEEPARVETAINSALLGKTLTDNYVAYTTHLSRIVDALSYALNRPFLGSVENVVDDEYPVRGPDVNGAVDSPPGQRSPWELLFWREKLKAESLRRQLLKAKHPRRHFTRLLAEYYTLPWPEGTPEIYDLKAPAVYVPPPKPDPEPEEATE